MASKDRQIKRWNNLRHPRPINLNCIICEYNKWISNQKQCLK